MATRFKCWTFTLFIDKIDKDNNNVIDHVDIDLFKSHIEGNAKKKCIKYICFQKEITPITGRYHLQGYLQYHTKHEATLKTTRKNLLYDWVHLEFSRGTDEENYNYCNKIKSSCEDTFYEYGIREECQGMRTDWSAINDMINDGYTLNEIMNEMPNKIPYINCIEKRIQIFQRSILKNKKYENVDVTVLTGDAGTRKTAKCLYDQDNEPLKDVYQIEPDNEGNLWFDGYEGEKTLVIDDFYGNIKYSFLLRLLEGHSQRLSVKGGFVYKNWNKVLITSNQHPAKWYSHFGITPALMRRINRCIHYKKDGTFGEYKLQLTTQDEITNNKLVYIV